MSTAELTDSTLVDLTVAEIRNRVNQEYPTKQIDEFIEVIASDAFLDYVNGIAELPSHEQRREETARTASVSTLERVGVPTPEVLVEQAASQERTQLTTASSRRTTATAEL